MKCNKCGKIITLIDFNSYNFKDENNQIAVKCSSCNDIKEIEKNYPIGIASLSGAAFLLVIFFAFNYLIFGFITIVLAIFAIVFHLIPENSKELQ